MRRICDRDIPMAWNAGTTSTPGMLLSQRTNQILYFHTLRNADMNCWWNWLSMAVISMHLLYAAAKIPSRSAGAYN